jgi:hypothetical protein
VEEKQLKQLQEIRKVIAKLPPEIAKHIEPQGGLA